LAASNAAARVGRGSISPPQLGQTPRRQCSAQWAHHVHSKLQMRASAESGGRSRSQHSHDGFIRSMTGVSQGADDLCQARCMYFIVVKFKTKPEWTDRWMDLVADFTAATREEPGNLWFEWSRSVEDPAEFVLVEAFTDDGAGPHVNSDHFKKATSEMGQALESTPKIVSRQVDGEGWDEMGEITVE
jgi:quinol monooxygenase YgiN